MTDKRTELTEEDLVARYRATHPASRVVGITKYIHNSSRSRQRGCVLCGWSGPSWSADWPKTKGAIRAEREHIADHLRQANQNENLDTTADTWSWDGEDGLTPEQLKALSDYSIWAGKKWKTRLGMDWMRAGSSWRGEYHILHTLRNTHGPAWLAGFKCRYIPTKGDEMKDPGPVIPNDYIEEKVYDLFDYISDPSPHDGWNMDEIDALFDWLTRAAANHMSSEGTTGLTSYH
jgi:hypothetical protein